jgi:peptide-methionine (S)-S-oxide reductase
VGYAGGTKQNPTYRSLGDHAETVQIDYDPTKLSYGDLLQVFWTAHDPFRRSWSRQYSSIIFVQNAGERGLAEASKAELEGRRGRPIHTEIVTYSGFTPAEDYHQKHSLSLFPEFADEFRRIYPSLADYVASTAVARVNGYLGGEGSYEELLKEADSLGLSPKRKEQLLELVRRLKGGQNCPLPAKEAAAP